MEEAFASASKGTFSIFDRFFSGAMAILFAPA